MRPISNSFVPNFEKDDFFLALKSIFSFWLYKSSKTTQKLETFFKEKFNFKYAYAFNSGRSAFLAILKAIDIKENNQIFVQAFTCNALLNPILKLKAKPIFVDIDSTLNLDPFDLEKKYHQAKSPKAIVIQHTFGFPAQIEKIKDFAKKHNLILVEDCAHSLGTKYNNQLAGTFGDISFFSFGRDKIVSSIFGGLVATNNEYYAQKIAAYQKSLKYPSVFWTFRALLTFIAFYLLLPIYNFLNIGKMLLFLLRKLKITLPAVYSQENKGILANPFPKKMPSALAILAINQSKKLGKLNNHRQELVNFYTENLKNLGQIKPIFSQWPEKTKPVFMRFPILVKNREGLLKRLKKESIYLEDGWADSVIVPKKSILKNFGYQIGSCPNAEKISKNIVNLPTNIHVPEKAAKKITFLIKSFYGNQTN